MATDTDVLPVLAQRTRIERTRPPLPPAVAQAVGIAASGFLAGATAIALVHRRRARRLLPARRGRRRGGQLTRIVSSRSFLVDVHLLGRD